MVDFLKIAFFVWTGLIFTTQAAVISLGIYCRRIGAVPELVYLITYVLSAIPFVLCFIAKSRGIPWSFGWGICFPLACIHSIEICAVACFPATAFREGGELKYRIPYLVVCFTLTLLTLLLTLLGIVVHYSCGAARLRWCQRPGRPTANAQPQALCRPSTTTSDDHSHLDPPLPYALRFISHPSIRLQSFDEEMQERHTVYTPSPMRLQAGARPSRNRLNLTIHTDIATPRAAYLILSPLETRPSGIGSLESGRDVEINSLKGSIKGEADRRFVVESSPKKHVRIGRGRDLA